MKKTETHPLDCNGKGEMFLISKPIGWTSFDVVKRMRTLLRAKKIGHAGTLDPRATGLLIVCTGPGTKAVNDLTELEKEYVGTLELGIQTASFDSETAVTEKRDATGISSDLLEKTSRMFTGKQLQIPPMYSAAKYGGKPLYTYARKGKMVHREGKEIDIREFTITNFAPPLVSFRVVCSKGTYIRSLVSDFGKQLRCGATLRSLERTRIGPFALHDAFSLEEIGQLAEQGRKREETEHDYRATA